MRNIAISIVVPVFNGEKYLGRCVDALLCQTFHDIEIIIVNDGSSDKTSEIAHSLETKDQRVVVIDKPNEGVSIARNIGIGKAKGEWIAFADVDDYYYPDGLKNLYDTAQFTRTRIILGNADKISRNGSCRQRHNNEKIEIRHDYPLCSFEMWGNLYSKTLLWDENHGFQPGLAYFEDRLLLTKLLAQEGCYSICPTPVYAHIENDDSVLASKNGMRKAQHMFWASKLLQEYIRKAPNFQDGVIYAHNLVYFAAFRHFVAGKNASFHDFKKLYRNYFDDMPRFYKSYFKSIYQFKKSSIKSKLKGILCTYVK